MMVKGGYLRSTLKDYIAIFKICIRDGTSELLVSIRNGLRKEGRNLRIQKVGKHLQIYSTNNVIDSEGEDLLLEDNIQGGTKGLQNIRRRSLPRKRGEENFGSSL